ncbi:glucose transporter 4 enhancer factor [Rhodnius prolixus]|uniref:glucose transporter 4 enhancer factor n=1 Tax=Rhodnius prolixus TaxID=13249 RepID=UPI003D187E01
MSTGKRLAKRSIIGTRVCVKGDDGIYYSGVINAVKTPGNSCAAPQTDTRYSVRFDPVSVSAPPFKREYRDVELIGPGFQTMQGIHLLAGQKVYITYNGREVSGEVIYHNQIEDEVLLTISPPGSEGGLEIKKRLEDVRLTECRKSARLQDQDTDYSRLADMAGDRRRLSSHNIDVPPTYGSRKRRPSSSQDDGKEDLMDECTAALVLMHLSCSPHSPSGWVEQLSPAASLSDACSWRSGTPSPPLSESAPNWLSASDEGIVLDDDFDELPKKKKATRLVYQCRWPGCHVTTTTCHSIEAHVRNAHLGPKNDGDGDEGMEGDDHEEEFYYTELEVGVTSPPPTLSHRDMARPPHEDPEYQRSFGQGNMSQVAGPISIPKTNFSWPVSATISPSSSQKQIKLSVSAPIAKLPSSPSRRVRGDTKKCRKVYGMEHRELWCTQCKWKKACTRFGD